MDVSLSDRALRVARLQLHIDSRIAGGGLVCERRVSEVVPGPKRPNDSRTLERRPEVNPGQLRGVERRADLRMSEDEILLRSVGGRRRLLLQGLECSRSELDRSPRSTALRRLEPVADERLPDCDQPLEELHVPPR